MEVRYEKVNDFADAYISGSYKVARSGAKTLNKAEFYFLVDQILQRTDNIDPEEILYHLTKK